MNLKYWLVVGAVLLGGTLFFLPKINLTADDNQKNKNEQQADALDETEVYSHHFAALDSIAQKTLADFDEEFAGKKDKKSQDSLTFKQISVWEQKNDLMISGLLFARLARNAQQKGPYFLEAGTRMLGAMETANDSIERQFAAQSALHFLDSASISEPNNLDYQASYAQAIALTDPAPLKGVSMLRKILEKNPKHQKTWYILGTLAVQSNQMEKANGRFAFLNENYPDFPDAWYYRAQVLYSLGNIDSTVICLKRFKALINEPMLKKEIDKQILEITKK
jgi:tetratricopeptide (TPR) repeat protein